MLVSTLICVSFRTWYTKRLYIYTFMPYMVICSCIKLTAYRKHITSAVKVKHKQQNCTALTHTTTISFIVLHGTYVKEKGDGILQLHLKCWAVVHHMINSWSTGDLQGGLLVLEPNRVYQSSWANSQDDEFSFITCIIGSSNYVFLYFLSAATS